MAQLEKQLRSKCQRLNNKKLTSKKRVWVAAPTKRETQGFKASAGAKKASAGNPKKPVRRNTLQKLKTTYVRTAHNATVGKPKLPTAAKKTKRPAPRVTYSKLAGRGVARWPRVIN